MRSHPYQAPPPLPPLLDDIVSYLPNQALPSDDGRSERSGPGEEGFPLAALDPDTSTLLPPRKKRHHVRIQGRLALVRSVSAANINAGLPSPASAGSSVASPRDPGASPTASRYESAAGSAASRRSSRVFAAVQTPQARRRSLDDIGETDSDTDEDEREVITRRDRQFRGYGIGGAGNIRTYPPRAASARTSVTLD